MEITLLPTGAAGLVALVVILILRGALVPRRTLRDLLAGRDALIAELVADRDARIAELSHERDTWRVAYETSETGRHLSQEQSRELLELSRTATHVLTSLPRAEGVGHAAATLDAETSKL